MLAIAGLVWSAQLYSGPDPFPESFIPSSERAVPAAVVALVLLSMGVFWTTVIGVYLFKLGRPLPDGSQSGPGVRGSSSPKRVKHHGAGLVSVIGVGAEGLEPPTFAL